MPLPVAGAAVIGQAAVKTPVFEFTLVGLRRLVAEQRREGDVDKHIVVALLEVVDLTGNGAVEESEIKTHVKVFDALPRAAVRGECAVGGDIAQQVAADIRALVRHEVIELIAVVIVDAALVTHLGVAGADFQVAQPVDIAQECLLVQAPCCRHAIAAVDLNQIAAVEIIVGAEEIREV